MTVEERQKRFMELLQEAQRITGIRLQLGLNSRTFGNGDMLQVEPVLNLIADSNWRTEEINATSNSADHP